MITKSGAKLLDFGLAKLLRPKPVDEATATAFGTEDMCLTEEGAILGTLQYMAPEQLEGRDADSRSDIFAFGGVLYEMATGRPAFSGKSRANLVAAILSSDPPPVSNSQKSSPAALDRVVKRCLEKDPDERWQSAGDLTSELKWISRAGPQPEIAAVPKRRKTQRYLGMAVALLAMVGLAALLVANWKGGRDPGATVHLSLLPPDKASFNQLALSPDGRRLAFTAYGTKQTQGLWVRPLDSQTAQFLPGTEDARGPFWSPDSRYIAFFTDDKLKRVDASGGTPETLCGVSHADMGTWNPNGVILFSSLIYQPIRRINLSDCSTQPVTRLDPSLREIGNSQSRFLPDGQHFLWVSNRQVPQLGLDIYVSSLGSEQRQLLIHNASMPEYVAPGRLVFVREGKVMAQGFDAKGLRTKGEPFPIVPERVAGVHFDGMAVYAVSTTNLLVYKPEVQSAFQLEWRNRSGQPIGKLAETGFNRIIQLSPDGNKVLMGRLSPETQMEDLWIFQIDPGAWTRFTFDPLAAAEARWSPDSKQVVYFAKPHGTLGIYRKAGDGSGTEETLFQQDHWLAARSIMPDGRYLLYETIDPESGPDLWLLPLFGDRKPVPFIQSSFGEGNASFSPDGRLVAYASDKSGQFEIYVRPFAGPGPESQISSGAKVSLMGGSPIAVHWRRDGKELFYLSRDWKVMSVPVSAGPAFKPSVPRPLFAVPPGSQVEAAGDGQRFLVNVPAQDSKAAPLRVILNWTLRPAAK